MELFLSHNDPANTDLFTSNGRVLYSISTPSRWMSRTTTVSKYAQDVGGSQEFARINWRSWRSSQVILNGQIMDIDTFFPKGGVFSR